MPSRSKQAKREKAIATYASLVGGIILARAVEDRALSDQAVSLPGDTLAWFMSLALVSKHPTAFFGTTCWTPKGVPGKMPWLFADIQRYHQEP